MRILMISIDRGLLGKGQLGDVLERHKKYGEFLDGLDIVVFSPRGYEEYSISEKVKSYPTNSMSKLSYFFDGLKIARKLSKQNKYDLIICQTPFITGLVGWFLKLQFKTKLLIHFHGDFWQNSKWLKESPLNILFLFISKLVVPKADAVRVMSQGQADKLKKVGGEVRVISTPVELEKFLNYESRINNKEKIVLHIGRDDEVKDYNTLIKTFKIIKEKIPEVKFVQAGADEKIKMAMGENDFSDITLMGKVDQDKLVELYGQSNIFILTSTSESFGKVLVEANASGKPVVSTATTGAKEIVKDGYNGYLASIGDARALAEKVLELLNNPDKANQIGENGRNLVKEKYGDNTNKLIKFWQDIIAK